MTIIGIDLGTTNSLVAVFKDGKSTLIPNQFNEFLTPSVVSIDENNNLIVGKLAKERLISNPSLSTSVFKRNMGTDKKVKLGKKAYLPEELSSFVIRQLVEDASKYLNEDISEAVISVPAYFNAKQRSATKLAGEMAGIKVERLVNEPSAAALACRQDGVEEAFVVFDFGGGTLDVSIVDCFDNVVSISAVSGDNFLGGRDFDEVIINQLCKENTIYVNKFNQKEKETLLRMAEKAKIELQTSNEAKISYQSNSDNLEMTLTNEKLFDISTAIFERIKKPIRQAIKDSGIAIKEISKFILVGGSCHMPVVREYLSQLINIPVVDSADVDMMVASGLGIYVGIKERDNEVKDLVLTDICPFSLSINILNHARSDKPLASRLIQRNTILPASRSSIYQTSQLGQNMVRVAVYQGEQIYANDNVLLGQLNVKIPVNHQNHETFNVTFSYDINAILAVEVDVLSNGSHETLILSGDGLNLTGKEADARIAELKKMAFKIIDDERNQLLLERAKRMFAEGTPAICEYLLGIISQYEAVIMMGNIRKIHKLSLKFESILNQIEDDTYSVTIFNENLEDKNDDDEELLS